MKWQIENIVNVITYEISRCGCDCQLKNNYTGHGKPLNHVKSHTVKSTMKNAYITSYKYQLDGKLTSRWW